MVKAMCPQCRRSLKVRDEVIGKRGRCPACGHSFVIQATSDQIVDKNAPVSDVRDESLTDDQEYRLQPSEPRPHVEGRPSNAYRVAPDVNAELSGPALTKDRLPARTRQDPQPQRDAPKIRSEPSEDKANSLQHRRMLLLAGSGAALGLALLIGAASFLLRGGEGNKAGGGTGADVSNYVVLDALPAGASASPLVQVVFTPTTPSKQSTRGRATTEERVSKSLWDIPPDNPDSTPDPVTTDLSLSIAPSVTTGAPSPPLLASLRGPYMMTGPLWKEYPWVEEYDRKAKTKVYVEKFPQPPSPIIDLRTGEPVGEFSFRANFALPGSRLSPDGQYLLTPDSDPGKQSTDRDGKLYIWKRNEPQPIAELQMPGHVTWIDFVAPDRVAMLAFTPSQVVQIWDAVKGELLHSIDVSDGRFKPPEIPRSFSDTNQNRFWVEAGPFGGTTVGAVSPRGRYIALGGDKGVTLVSAADGELIGMLPIEAAAIGIHYHGMSFSEDSNKLYQLATYALAPKLPPGRDRNDKPRAYPKLTVDVWDIPTGRKDIHVTINEERLNFGRRGVLLPGPVPGTLYFGSFLTEGGNADCISDFIDIWGGSFVQKAPYLPLRWADSDRLLAVAKDGEKQLQVSAITVDRDAILAQAGEALSGVAARPRVLDTDRSGLKTLKPEPPTKWTSPPAIATPPRASAERMTLSGVPTTAGDGLGVVLSYRYSKVQKARHELHAQLVSLINGRNLGETFLLWPWITPPDNPAGNSPHDMPATHPLAALASDGKHLAVRDPANHRRVDIWIDTTRIAGIEPYEQDIEWIGWSATAKLLTLGAGKLTAWDAATAKASYEVEGDYSGPAASCPGGDWLAAAAGDVIDLIDTETGKCFGRRSCSVRGGEIVAIAIAPDGKTVAAARPAISAQAEERFLADFWDTTTGMGTYVPFGGQEIVSFSWSTPEHLLSYSATPETSGPQGSTPEFKNRIELLDRSGAIACQYNISNSFPKLSTGLLAVASTPDGRIWVGQNGHWRSQELVNPASSAGGKLVDATAQPLRIEVDVGNRYAGLAMAEALASEMQKQGFSIGRAGWVLRVGHQVEDSQKTISFGSARDAVPIPQVRFTWQMLDSSGAVVWEDNTIGRFAGTGSKYYKKTKVGGVVSGAGGAGIVSNDEFDFQGDMHRAVVTEILDTQSPNLQPPRSLPRGKLLKVAGTYRPLPLQSEIPSD